MNLEQQAQLRAPFPPEQIHTIPRKGARLDYVGHADVTDRLLAVDPSWTWEPVSPVERETLPPSNGLWIKLTVCGVTRIGYGDADGKTGGDAIKEMIGDAIRNAAMRFGVALDLWSKSDKPAKPSDTAWILDLKKRAQAAQSREALLEIYDEVGDGLNDGKCTLSEATDLRSFVKDLGSQIARAVEGVVA